MCHVVDVVVGTGRGADGVAAAPDGGDGGCITDGAAGATSGALPPVALPAIANTALNAAAATLRSKRASRDPAICNRCEVSDAAARMRSASRV